MGMMINGMRCGGAVTGNARRNLQRKKKENKREACVLIACCFHLFLLCLLGGYHLEMALTQEHLDLLVCPVCFGRLRLVGETVECLGCRRRYPVVDGLPVLLAARAVQG
jgi:uncharacterized protein YbaR (Trm112 family)